jgi:hypothetical protein
VADRVGYIHHPSFERPDAAATIWRYVDFAKFVDLIDRAKLFFARADSMTDPWEGAMSPQMESANVDKLVRMQEEADSRLEQILPNYASFGTNNIQCEYQKAWRQMRTRMYLSCWCLGEQESAAMWELYGSAGSGIAIRSTFGRLEQALPSDWAYPILAGKVHYLDYQRQEMPLGNAFDRFLRKRLSFEHERELRMIIDTHNELAPRGGLRVPVALEILLHRIHVAPTAPDWFAELVQRTVGRYGLEPVVIRSDLLTDPVQ